MYFIKTKKDLVKDKILADNYVNSIDGLDNKIFPNLTNGDNTDDFVDLLSNGLKNRSTDGGWNAADATYIYAAFAENPFVNSSGVPVNAR